MAPPVINPLRLTFLFCLLQLSRSYFFALASSPHLLPACAPLCSGARLDDKTLMLFFVCPPFSLAIHSEE